MRNLKKKKPSSIIHIILIVLMVIMVVGSVWGYDSQKKELSNNKEKAQVFNSMTADFSYSKLIPEFLSKEFATNYDDSINYLFAIDKNHNTYIVALKADDMDKYKDLIEYTYSDDGTAPALVTLQGTPRRTNPDIIKMAIESYNDIYGKDMVNKTNFDTVLGVCYLDTTIELPGNFIFMNICIFILIAFAFIYILIMDKERRYSKRRKTTIDRFDNNAIFNVDNEINHASATYFHSQNLFITKNYIVSTVRGFDIIPLNEVIHLYGCVYEKKPKTAITVVTNDGIKHEIAAINLNKKGTELLDEIVNRIKTFSPDIAYGFKDGFYIVNTTSNQIYEEINSAEEFAISNLLLGTIGALLGAFVGGVIWIIIGKLGLIAGLAGFAMMFFAIMGYNRFAGHIDKKGKIISLVIAFIMIFLANYTLYALDYCKVYFYSDYSTHNLIESYKHLSGYLTLTDRWGVFMRNLVIGYALSIWSGFGILKAVFSKKK